jgi:hypothetical protein
MSALPDRRQPVLLISAAVAIAGLAVLAAVFGLAWVLVA